MPIEQGPIPVDENEPLWRYVRLNTLFHYLAGKAFIPSIKTLRECDPTEGLEVCDEVWAMVGFSDEEKCEIAKWVYEKRLSPGEKKCWDVNKTHPGANQLVYLQHYYEVLEETRYAWCWFRSNHESAAMWQLYGHDGAALRTTLKSLSSMLDSNGQVWLVSGVKYINRNQDLGRQVAWGSNHIAPWIRRPFLVKRKEYEHEHEVRLVKVDPGGRPGITLEGVDPEKWMENIVFWPGFPRSEAEALVQAVARISPNLAKRTQTSQLFQRDPTSSSDSAREALKEDCAGLASKDAQNWPSLLSRP